MSLMVTVKYSPRRSVDGLIFTLCSLMRLPPVPGFVAASTAAFGGRKYLKSNKKKH